MDYKLSLVAMLHDIGKILQRADLNIETYVKCNECKSEKYEHDKFSCEFIYDYLGEEYVNIFKSGIWKKSDIASATERISDNKNKYDNIKLTPLFDPLFTLNALKDNKTASNFYEEKVWHPVLPIDFNKSIETYQIDKFYMASNKGSYSNVKEKLLMLSDLAKNIKDPKSLLETYDAILRTVGTFVPAAIYGTSFPDTSLYGHSRLAAALASFDQFRLLYIDIKGIQRFITNIKTEAEASKRLRGRSFFLVLLQQAILDYISEKYNLSSINNIVFEPGKLLLIVPPDFNIDSIRKLLLKISEWSDYQLQFSISLSDPIDINEICFYCENENKRSVKFSEALSYVIENQQIIGEPLIKTENIVVDHYEERTLNSIKVSEDIGLNSLAPGEFMSDEYISLINLISLIVGHSTRNLKYIIEVLYKDEFVGSNRYYASNNYGEIFIKPLSIGFFLISGEEESFDIRLQKIINSIKDNVLRIKIFSINEPSNFIISKLLETKNKESKDQTFDKISFDYMITSTYHPINEIGGFSNLDEIGNYIAISLLDGDGIGGLIKELSEYPGRFVTFSILLNFAFNYALLKFINENLNKNSKIIVLYSGGDDLGIYGDWKEVANLLIGMEDKVKRLIPMISVSGSFVIFKAKYPISFAYSEAIELEHVAKRERKLITKNDQEKLEKQGRVMSNLFEKYYIDAKSYPEGEKISSLSWDEFNNVFNLSKDLNESDISSSYLYKLYSIGDEFDVSYELPYDNIASGIVTYAYLNARNKDNYNKLKDLASKRKINLLDYPSENKQTDFKDIINSLMKFRTVVNLYGLYKRSESR